MHTSPYPTWTHVTRQLCCILALLALSHSGLAQVGRWVPHSLQNISGGGVTAVCGHMCLVAVTQYPPRVLFFDVNCSRWTELDIGTQVPSKLLAAGNVAFGYTDSLLIGYSALTSQAAILPYAGALLATGTAPSYGCSNSLVLFATTHRMYVFDAATGQWYEFDYHPAPAYNGGKFWVKDDYAAMVLYRGFAESPHHTVYSSVTRGFSQLDQGPLRLAYPEMDHGYAGIVELGGDNYEITGYSALTNHFTKLPISGEGYARDFFQQQDPDRVGEITSYAIAFREVVTPYVLVRTRFYGYDTRRGSWSSTTVDFPSPDWNYSGSGATGGQYGVDFAVGQDSKIMHLFYSGLDGQWRTIISEASPSSTSFGRCCGGTAYFGGDNIRLWGYDIAGNRESVAFDERYWRSNRCGGANFCTETRWSADSDTMTLYCYGSDFNSWISTQTRKQVYEVYSAGRHVFVLNSTDPNGIQSEVVFYSPYSHTIVKRHFNTSYVSVGATDFLAAAATADHSVLFNAQDGNLLEASFQFQTYWLKDSAVIFRNSSGTEMVGYSAIVRQGTSFTPPEPITGCIPGDVVSIGITADKRKVYTYNGVHNCWVEFNAPLENTSRHLYTADGRTALLVYNQGLFAFSPDMPTDVTEGTDLPARFVLEQNYPNPFNPRTKIRFEIPDFRFVRLAVYDVLGRETAVLINEKKTPGTHAVTFDGAGFAGGVYFYRMSAGEYVATRKMILLR